MADHHVGETSERGIGIGVVLGIVLALLVVVIALFFAFGGPTRFVGGAPSQTNINVPAQQLQPQSAPNVQAPRQIDVNVNQPPAQQAPAQPPAQQAPAQPPAQAPAQPTAQQAPAQPTTQQAQTPPMITVGDNTFTPPSVTVRTGTAVTWDWVNTRNPHSVVGRYAGQDVDSGRHTGSERFVFTFSSPGTFDFQCGVHGTSMSGRVTVQ
jgi:plastocyanin